MLLPVLRVSKDYIYPTFTAAALAGTNLEVSFSLAPNEPSATWYPVDLTVPASPKVLVGAAPGPTLTPGTWYVFARWTAGSTQPVVPVGMLPVDGTGVTGEGPSEGSDVDDGIL